MLTDEQINAAKKTTRYSTTEKPLHEHNDCIRFAFEWLDAQVKTKGCTKKPHQLKHLIERWAGRYVSTHDVDVAAQMHPDIHGDYPYFNISSKLTNPSFTRISGLGETYSHNHGDRHDLGKYSKSE
ncbi:hypothetical protein [Pseudomonas fluorescens]|uniref:Uncharacterized protein n=1 Tax=Pseudomonas fluorescens TaxID=294 RepID=A0A7Z3GYV1_PSEFL|nr:hypothetical protein [Pseudomonas fluorescens]QJP93749.1 hypothetical protein C6Y56_03805 [Pseudomonas fluorescens]